MIASCPISRSLSEQRPAPPRRSHHDLDEGGKEWGLAGRTVVSLCRCGQSAKKPFCDGSHNRVGFSSSCEAAELPPPAPKA
jgi:CDGSH-type Zn-finger protein